MGTVGDSAARAVCGKVAELGVDVVGEPERSEYGYSAGIRSRKYKIDPPESSKGPPETAGLQLTCPYRATQIPVNHRQEIRANRPARAKPDHSHLISGDKPIPKAGRTQRRRRPKSPLRSGRSL